MSQANEKKEEFNGVKCCLWTRQILDRLHQQFPEHTQNIDRQFLTLYSTKNKNNIHQQSADLAIHTSLYLLSKIDPESLPVRSNYLRFLELVIEMESLLNRTLDLNSRYNPVEGNPHKFEVLPGFPTSN